MNRILFLFLALVISVQSFSQDQNTNLQKYWRYRDRLRQHFILISQNVEYPGVNIPASRINFETGTVDWSDGNAVMSHYLSVLSTELFLLKKNNQDYTQTLTELYYAMLAMERLDLWSENSVRGKKNIVVLGSPLGTDINGFHLRDDVSSGFWDLYKSHFPVANFSSVYSPDGSGGDYHENSMEEMSQDNTFHNMEGLALVANLVGTESVANIPASFYLLFGNPKTPAYLTSKGIMTGNNIDFSLWAKDFIKRYINFFQTSGSIIYKYYGPLGNVIDTSTDFWVLKNPVTGDFVREGSGEDLETGAFYNSGIISTGQNVTGENLRIHNAFVLTNSQSSSLFNSLFQAGSQNIDLDPWPPNPFGLKTFHIYSYDDYKVRSLGMNGNVLGSESTFPTLRSNRIAAVDGHSYEHLPMMYSIMSDVSRHLILPGSTAYNQDKAFIENLLNTAPSCGPTSNGNINWSVDSRCVWPELLGSNASHSYEYNGLDYMMLHNLYYIAFNYSTIISGNTGFNNGTFNFDFLEAYHQIPSGKNAIYIGKEAIILKPGFTAASGSVFNAKMVADASSYVSTQYKTLSVTRCGAMLRTSTTDTQSSIDDINAYETLKFPTGGQLVTENPSTETVIKIIAETESVDGVHIKPYPNPTKGNIKIVSGVDLSEPATVTIYNNSGKPVLTTQMKEREMVLDISSFQEGLYVIKIQGRNLNITGKIILIH